MRSVVALDDDGLRHVTVWAVKFNPNAAALCGKMPWPRTWQVIDNGKVCVTCLRILAH